MVFLSSVSGNSKVGCFVSVLVVDAFAYIAHFVFVAMDPSASPVQNKLLFSFANFAKFCSNGGGSIPFSCNLDGLFHSFDLVISRGLVVRYANALSGCDVELTFLDRDNLVLGRTRAEGSRRRQVLLGPSLEPIVEYLSMTEDLLLLHFTFLKATECVPFRRQMNFVDNECPNRPIPSLKCLSTIEYARLRDPLLSRDRHDVVLTDGGLGAGPTSDPLVPRLQSISISQPAQQQDQPLSSDGRHSFFLTNANSLGESSNMKTAESALREKKFGSLSRRLKKVRKMVERLQDPPLSSDGHHSFLLTNANSLGASSNIETNGGVNSVGASNMEASEHLNFLREKKLRSISLQLKNVSEMVERLRLLKRLEGRRGAKEPHRSRRKEPRHSPY